MIYTGIGSRETPESVRIMMFRIAKALAEDGWTLRSGGAPGADLAFESGADAVQGSKEIFLPWKSFNAELREDSLPGGVYVGVSDEAMAVAEEYHPSFRYLKHGAKKLMARNSYQVLGFDLMTPTNMVVCWTPGGKHGGGTGQAIRIALDHDIPVVDLGGFEDLNDGIGFLGDLIETLTIPR